MYLTIMYLAVYLVVGAYALGTVLFYLNAKEMRHYCGLNPTDSNLASWKNWYVIHKREEPEWLKRNLI